MIPLMEVLRVKPEGAARAGLVEAIPDSTPPSQKSGARPRAKVMMASDIYLSFKIK
jgi:hypothetical protein